MVGPSPRRDVGFILTLIELLGHAVVAEMQEISTRWDYNIVPTRRLRKKALMVLTSPAEREYKANQTIQNCVMRFAYLLEGLLAGAADALPHLLPD
ncbi:hypothetical protein TraAM80_03807, partial [Trypanosoma rangeli]